MASVLSISFSGSDNDVCLSGKTEKEFLLSIQTKLSSVEKITLFDPDTFFDKSPKVFVDLLYLLSNGEPGIGTYLRIHVVRTRKNLNPTVTSMLQLFPEWDFIAPDVYLVKRQRYASDTEPLLMVTAIYDIREDEPKSGKKVTKSIDDYIRLGSWLNEISDVPLVLFTSAELVSKVEKCLEKRRGETIIVLLPFNETPAYTKWHSSIKERFNLYTIQNRDPDKDTPEYITLTANKLFLIKKALKLFKTKKNVHRVMWVDFGIAHVEKNTWFLQLWKHNIPEKLRLMCVSPWGGVFPTYGQTKDHHDWEYHKIWYHHVAGGLITGSPLYMTWFADVFEQYMNKILGQGYFQNEQVIFTLILRDFYPRFYPYFGDFCTILQNYRYPRDFWWLLHLQASSLVEYEKTRQNNKQPSAIWLMKHLDEYTRFCRKVDVEESKNQDKWNDMLLSIY